MIDVPDVPLDIRPRKVNIFNEVLHITWPGQRQSQFTFKWLSEHSYRCIFLLFVFCADLFFSASIISALLLLAVTW
jgi:hypothetical protein